MGYLTEKLFKQVHRLAQERGRSYFFAGSVRQIEGDAWRASARVQGASLYEVGISSEDDFLDVKCSCPYFDRELQTCKHIWAALMAAERQGLLKGAASRKSLQIFEAIEESEPDDGAFKITEDRRNRQGVIKPVALVKPARSEWKPLLQSLRSAMTSAENHEEMAPAPDRQLFFRSDADCTLDSQHRIMQVPRRVRLLLS